MAALNQLRLHHSIGSLCIPNIRDRARDILRSLMWLESKQHHDGSWGRHGNELDQIISTKHAVLTLLALGYPGDDPRIRRAVEWFTSPARTHHHIFQRCFALLGMPSQIENVQRDIQEIEALIRRRSAPHKDQMLELDVLHIYSVLRKVYPRSSEYVAAVAKEWTAAECWCDRAPATAYALSVLSEFEFEDKPNIVRVSKEFLRRKANVVGDKVHWEGLVVSTSYVVFSVVESDLSQDPAMLDLARRAVSWILSKRGSDGFWEREQPILGGDIQSEEYVTSVAMRAVAALESYDNPLFALEVLWLRSRDTASRLRVARVVVLCATVSVATVAIGAAAYLMIHIKLDLWAFLLGAFGLISGAAGLIQAWQPKWYQRWLSRRARQ
jgi:hypothetical protein